MIYWVNVIFTKRSQEYHPHERTREKQRIRSEIRQIITSNRLIVLKRNQISTSKVRVTLVTTRLNIQNIHKGQRVYILSMKLQENHTNHMRSFSEKNIEEEASSPTTHLNAILLFVKTNVERIPKTSINQKSIYDKITISNEWIKEDVSKWPKISNLQKILTTCHGEKNVKKSS